jgi:hypothetical protein
MRLRITCLYSFLEHKVSRPPNCKLKHDQSRTSFELCFSDVDAELTRLVEDAVQVEDDCTNVCNTQGFSTFGEKA